MSPANLRHLNSDIKRSNLIHRSIVNGLRDDDEESFYGNRASFVSEYSLRDNEGVQVFFKEHGRKGSKDSQASSFLSRKKPTQGSKRPETKVRRIA